MDSKSPTYTTSEYTRANTPVSYNAAIDSRPLFPRTRSVASRWQPVSGDSVQCPVPLPPGECPQDLFSHGSLAPVSLSMYMSLHAEPFHPLPWKCEKLSWIFLNLKLFFFPSFFHTHV